MNESGTLKNREAWFVPIAIICAGLILALSLYVHRSHQLQGSVQGDATLVDPVSTTDHIIGNPTAPVVLIEYADIDSSYSKTFQRTMEDLMNQYAPGGQVAWVYRHLPLIDQHVYSEQHAEAAECISSLGGPNIFWRFIDELNSQAPGDLQFNPANYDSVVDKLGILPQSFDQCMQAHTFQARVSEDFQNGLAVGAGGSPFSVLMVKGKPPITINGAVPYDAMKKILDGAVSEALK